MGSGRFRLGVCLGNLQNIENQAEHEVEAWVIQYTEVVADSQRSPFAAMTPPIFSTKNSHSSCV